MLKICGSSIYKPLELIFKLCIETGVFPSQWTKANTVPIHKKGEKQPLKSCHPVSLLQICAKFLKDYCSTKCFTSLLKMNLFYQISPVLNQVILALTSCYLSLMSYISPLMRGLKLEASFLIYQKHLIKCGMMV